MAMIQVRSFVKNQWVMPQNDGNFIASPINGKVIAHCNSGNLDMASLVDYARNVGGKNLRRHSFYQRAMMLKALAGYLHENRKALYPLSWQTGATQKDSLVDIDGGISTLFVFASKGRRELADCKILTDGGLEMLSRSGNFVGQHIWVPRTGVAVHINAFNFPVWGMLEKFAPAFLAGMPIIVKPASSTCYLTELCVKIMLQSKILPEGALQLIAGGAQNLLDYLQSQDVVSFTGSAVTGNQLRTHQVVIANSVRFIAEQDSLNAAILGQDSDPESAEFQQMLRETVRELTVKAGQKCTAMRRLLLPETYFAAFSDALQAKLRQIIVGDPHDKNTMMGPLVSYQQKQDMLQIITQLTGETEKIFGGGELALNGDDSDAEKGAFMAPMLLYCAFPDQAKLVHEIEAFAPVATMMPYRDPGHAALLANRGGGSLVVSVFTKNADLAREFVLESACYHGRIYFANGITGKEATGHGSPLPHLVHGGPGRAGGGEELGGLRGLHPYLQRTAIQGNPDLITAIAENWVAGSEYITEGAHPFRLYFEDLRIGKTYLSPKREITMADIEKFADFTGDKFYAHLDEVAAKANPFFEGRVAHGYLLLSFAAGLFVDPEPGPVLANYGIDNLRFTQPVYPGESIWVALTVKTKDNRTDEYGEVRWHVAMFNDKQEQVASYELLTMNAKAG